MARSCNPTIGSLITKKKLWLAWMVLYRPHTADRSEQPVQESVHIQYNAQRNWSQGRPAIIWQKMVKDDLLWWYHTLSIKRVIIAFHSFARVNHSLIRTRWQRLLLPLCTSYIENFFSVYRFIIDRTFVDFTILYC
jgi:hypothetical protein